MKPAKCVICGAPVISVLDLRDQPLANDLPKDNSSPANTYPLGLAYCANCTHGQLTFFVNQKELFQEYCYASGTSRTLNNYFAWFAKGLVFKNSAQKKVLEIASNDGSLLTCLAKENCVVTGIDPASNLNSIARGAGHQVLTGFFPETKPDDRFDIIVAMNVVAHTPTPLPFMVGVASSLKRGGVAIIQTSQAMMLGNGEFDTIYHEHYSFFTVASMCALAEHAGLRVESVRLVSVHGTSFLFFLRHADDDSAPFLFRGGAPYEMAWPHPEPPFLSRQFAGAVAQRVYEEFVIKADSLMRDVAARIETHRAAGRKIAMVGVAAKALTFIKAANIEPDIYLDEAELKIGRYVPGASKPILPFDTIPDLDEDVLFFIGAWNFADELKQKVSALYRRKPRFLIHLPTLREIT